MIDLDGVNNYWGMRMGVLGSDNVPIKEELQDLPVWAIVAFAARCASRVQPLFAAAWPDAPVKHVQAVEDAIAAAWLSAANANYVSLRPVADAAADASDAADVGNASSDAAMRVADAAAAVADACTVAKYEQNGDVAAFVSDAFQAAHDAALIYSRDIRVRPELSIDTDGFMLHDYLRIRHAASQEGWGEDTPVPPEFFGPLWPHGEPDEWPEVQKSENQPVVLKLELVVPNDMDDGRAEEYDMRVAAFLSELSALHAAMGGNGLRILDHDSCSPVFAVQEDPERYPVVVGGAS